LISVNLSIYFAERKAIEAFGFGSAPNCFEFRDAPHKSPEILFGGHVDHAE